MKNMVFTAAVAAILAGCRVCEPGSKTASAADDGRMIEVECRIVDADNMVLVTPRIVTQSGKEGVSKNVTEYIYPTQYSIEMGTNGIVAVEPEAFTKREVGVVVAATPTLRDDGLVALQLAASVVDEPAWKDYGQKLTGPDGKEYSVPMEQPFFPVRSFETNLTLSPGKTVMAVSADKDGKSIVPLVTVRLVETK